MNKYVVILDSGHYVIGPFASFNDAQDYKNSDPECDVMRVWEIVPPEPDWKRRVAKKRSVA